MKIKSVTLPKFTERRISWNKDEKGNYTKGGHAILLVGYCPDTLPYFTALAKDLKKRIPEANINEAICGKVSKSDYIYGYTVLIAPISGKYRKIKGFDERDVDFNY